MTTFQTCWVIAGLMLGWIAPELMILIRPNLNVPRTFNIMGAFVGGLVAYTIVAH